VALSEALHWYPTATCAVVTDISRDGMLSGSDVEGLRAAGTISPLPLIASGGIGTLDDISALLNIVGVSGVITGKAIYENRFTVAEAIAAANAGRQ
jgi:phosphoribosylformimino-5-aminoimidazole carboxamide ribonucleotide (ProFAR) isomerase